jgi:hypothetical protein
VVLAIVLGAVALVWVVVIWAICRASALADRHRRRQPPRSSSVSVRWLNDHEYEKDGDDQQST